MTPHSYQKNDEKRSDCHMNGAQDRPPNFRDDGGRLFLIRCYACDNERGRENWAPVVATGQCAWCGWSEP